MPSETRFLSNGIVGSCQNTHRSPQSRSPAAPAAHGGEDKGLLKLKDKPLVEWVLARIQPQVDEI